MPEDPTLSIIIPCLNDAVELRHCLVRLENVRKSGAEIVVCDATEDESCRDVVREFSVAVVRCAGGGRGPQLNAGAAAARGEVLLFNHCDTLLLPDHVTAVRQAVQRSHPPFRCGAFFKDLPWHYPRWAWADSLVRRWSTDFGTVYGDQTQFFRRSHFERLGGYPDIPIMEDVVMSGRMRRGGGFLLLDPPLRTSMRRFQQRGRLKNRAQNLLLLALFHAGLATPQGIYRWYYRRSPARKPN